MRRKLNKNAEMLRERFGLSRREAARIELLLTEVQIQAGEILAQQGGTGRQLLIILEGEAEVYRDGAPLTRLRRGDLIGEISMLGISPRSTADVTAVTTMRALAAGTGDVARMDPRGRFILALQSSAALRSVSRVAHAH